MEALQYHGPWQMTLVELPMPEPGEGEVLLRTLAVGICGSDVHGFTGESGRRQPGMVMGHEVVGEVAELGPGVSDVKVGQRAAVFNIVGCGRCHSCFAGQEQMCPARKVLGVSGGTWGAMAAFFTIPQRCLVPLPGDVAPAVGVLAEPIAVGLHAIRKARPQADDVTVIVGAGTIGIGLAIGLSAEGVREFMALDKIDAKLDLIRRFGARPINVAQEDARKVIDEATRGEGARCVFEAVGAAATVRDAFGLCGNGATLVLIGNIAKEFTLPLQGVTSNEITICGSYGFTRQDFIDAMKIVASGQLPLDILVSGTCRLQDAPDTMTRIARGELQPVKYVIEVGT
ncbi:MAG: alcohol dehydrogenase catalytic domain-containing protein [Phycisphaeraceae bacterium]